MSLLHMLAMDDDDEDADASENDKLVITTVTVGRSNRRAGCCQPPQPTQFGPY